MDWPASCRTHVGNTGFMAPSLDVSVRFHDEVQDESWLLRDALA